MVIDIDHSGAVEAYRAGDEAAFARIVEPLGIELSIETLASYLAKGPGRDAIARVLEVLRHVVSDEVGIAMWTSGDGEVAIARREGTTILVGLADRTPERAYGFPEIKRWYGEVSKNRAAVERWAKSPQRAADSLRLAVRAPASRTHRDDEEAALLAAVIADPDDDATRLVLADHWIERGDPRGELIQCQCRLAAEPEPRDGPLHVRAEAALQRCWAMFRRDVGDAWHVVRRGFVDEVELTVPALARQREKLFAKHPIRTLVVRVSTDAHLQKLGTLAPLLPTTIDHVVIDGRLSYPTSTARLDLAMPALSALYRRGRALSFRSISASSNAWRAAISTIHARALGIESCSFDSAIYEALANPSNMRSLEALTIEHVAGNPTLTTDMVGFMHAIGARLQTLSWSPSFVDGYDVGAVTRAFFERATLSTYGTTRHREEDAALVDPLFDLPQARSLRAIRIHVDPWRLSKIATIPNVVEAWARLAIDMSSGQIDRVADALASSKIERVIVTDAVPAALARRAPHVTFLGRGPDGTLHLAHSA